MSILSQIKNSKPGDIIRDDVIRGLHLKHLPSGRKSFYVFYRTKGGVQRRPKIGEYPITPLDYARKVAAEILREAMAGKDPQGSWKKQKEELSLKNYFEEKFDLIWGASRFSKSGHAYEVSQNFKNHVLPYLGAKKLSSLSFGEIREWYVARSKKSVVAANRSLSVLSKIYGQAIQDEIVERNLCSNIQKEKEKKRSRYATAEELKKLNDVLANYESSHANNVKYIKTLMLTGARPSVFKNATWADVVYNGDDIFLAIEGKTFASTGVKDIIVLPEFFREKGVGKIFSLKNINGFWRKIADEAGCPDLWMRDLRRTFATVGMGSGQSISRIGELLNHSSVETTKVYAKLDQTKRVEAAKEIREEIEEIIY